MGTLTLNIDYPDAKQAAMIAALRWHYGPKDPNADPVVEFTTQELLDLYNQGYKNALKDIYLRHQKHLRDTTALDTLDVT